MIAVRWRFSMPWPTGAWKRKFSACVVNGHDADKAAVAAVNAINTYYSRGKVPVGASYHGSHGTTTQSKYTAKLRDEFPHVAPADDKAPDALQIYRRALARTRSDGSVVVVVSVGFLMNLSDLLDSKADDASPLTGLELTRQKVRRLVVMGGQFPNPQRFEEWNFTAGNGGRDTQHVVEKWPTPILFSGFSISTARESPPDQHSKKLQPRTRFDALISCSTTPWKNGLLELGSRRPCWRPCCRSRSGYWSVVADGYCSVDAKGVDSWSPTRRIEAIRIWAPKLSNAEVSAQVLDSLMAGAAALRH